MKTMKKHRLSVCKNRIDMKIGVPSSLCTSADFVQD